MKIEEDEVIHFVEKRKFDIIIKSFLVSTFKLYRRLQADDIIINILK